MFTFWFELDEVLKTCNARHATDVGCHLYVHYEKHPELLDDYYE